MYFGTRTPENHAWALLDQYVAAGGTWLDTADNYAFWADPSGLGGASERVVGSWLRVNHGAPVKVATKVRWAPLVPHRWPESAAGLSAPAVRRAVEGSLDRLGLDAVDLLWAHGEDRDVPLSEVVGVFGDLVAEGRARRLGAANHAAWRVERARALAVATGRETFSALQLRHSLLQPRPGAGLPDSGHRLLADEDLDLAQDAGLAVWAYTPLLNGAYSRSDKPLPAAYDHPGTRAVSAVLDDVTAETGATRHQVVLAWLRAQGITPLVGVSTPGQLAEALDGRALQLSADHLARFAAAR
ncbi:aldo/keto reductase [Nakamurella flava]|uniref:Aldo/keto reductase n=2 Tax=Nakamurella flava TaxID=2576308 RepID=A0A4U6QP01_9ACTN|nr:aldo/keto reductase [Nakamurella flava]